MEKETMLLEKGWEGIIPYQSQSNQVLFSKTLGDSSKVAYFIMISLMGIKVSPKIIREQMGCGKKKMETITKELRKEGLLESIPDYDQKTKKFIGSHWKVVLPENSKSSDSKIPDHLTSPLTREPDLRGLSGPYFANNINTYYINIIYTNNIDKEYYLNIIRRDKNPSKKLSTELTKTEPLNSPKELKRDTGKTGIKETSKLLLSTLSNEQSSEDPASTSKNSRSSRPEDPEKRLRKLKYEHRAKHLAKVIQYHKKIKFTTRQQKSWADDIRKLVELHEIPLTRIDRAITQYDKVFGKKYIPVILSGKSFREKFINLEEAIKREREEEKESYQKPTYQEPTPQKLSKGEIKEKEIIERSIMEGRDLTKEELEEIRKYNPQFMRTFQSGIYGETEEELLSLI